MAAESLLGGAGDDLDQVTKNFLDQILADTVGGLKAQGGTAEVTDLGNGGQLIVGVGQNGEIQGVAITRDLAVAGVLNDGQLEVSFSLPAGVDLGFEGLPQDATPAQALRIPSKITSLNYLL